MFLAYPLILCAGYFLGKWIGKKEVVAQYGRLITINKEKEKEFNEIKEMFGRLNEYE